MDTTRHDTAQHLWSLIKDIRFAMVTTQHANGHLHAWPMTMQNKSLDEGRLWFFMSRHGEAVHELMASPSINVAFADPDKDTYVSLSAVASVVNKPEKVRELWTRMDDAWFKGGADDADLALVEATIIHGHYWDVKESKLTQLMLMAKAALSGQERPRLGESGDIRL